MHLNEPFGALQNPNIQKIVRSWSLWGVPSGDRRYGEKNGQFGRGFSVTYQDRADIFWGGKIVDTNLRDY